MTIAQALISSIECKYSWNQGTVKSEIIHGQMQKGRFCIRPKFKRSLFILFLWRYSRTYCRHSNRHVLGTLTRLNMLSALYTKIQQTKMLVYVSKVWWFVFIWADLAVFFSSDKNNKGRFNAMATYCSSNINLSLPSYTTGSALKRALNFCNGYLSLLYFWFSMFVCF